MFIVYHKYLNFASEVSFVTGLIKKQEIFKKLYMYLLFFPGYCQFHRNKLIFNQLTLTFCMQINNGLRWNFFTEKLFRATSNT